MNTDLLLLAAIVGGATWAFRFIPTWLRLSGQNPDSILRRLLAATGPAAIATLFTASVLPMLRADNGPHLPLLLGTSAVLLLFALRRSVVLATVGGALVYGLTILAVAVP